MHFSSISEVLEDVRAGKMVIVVDDANRENEGDLTLAAEKATPQAINFMLSQARGIL
ncbi:MAG TPA: 3,4-dihydroxy-2-butanone-4-phosphate synthase, partial [Candidatus Brocadiales bacterium]|nr:3,4-dihydroxy-2-butanone-4-phosphate synthase [Candidatus Brocadiales bacterium]